MTAEATVTCLQGIAVGEVPCYDPDTDSSSLSRKARPLHGEEGVASDVEHHQTVGDLCDCKDAVRHEVVSVNHHYHRDVLRHLREQCTENVWNDGGTRTG